LISALLILSLISIPAVPVHAETKTPVTSVTTSGGYYYDEMVIETESYPHFIFGAGDIVCVVFEKAAGDGSTYTEINQYDRDMKITRIIKLPVNASETYYDFYCDISGEITAKSFIKDSHYYSPGTIYTYTVKPDKLVLKETERVDEVPRSRAFKTLYLHDDVETFYDRGETDIKSLVPRNGNVYAIMRDGTEQILSNMYAINYGVYENDTVCDLQRGDFAEIDGREIHIFRKTDRPHPDLIKFTIGTTSDTDGFAAYYINEFNFTQDKYIADTRTITTYLDNVDVVISMKDNKYYNGMLDKKELANIYDFMGTEFFDEEKILMNLLRFDESDGKLLGISPEWDFKVLTANSETVSEADFESIDAVYALEKRLTAEALTDPQGNEYLRHIFAEDTDHDAFDTLFGYYFNDFYDGEKVSFNPTDIGKYVNWAKLYPTYEEYTGTSDYLKSIYTNLDYDGYSYTYYQYPPYEYSQFDVLYYRDGRYNAAVFTGETFPQDIMSTNIFYNFSSFVNILYKGNFVLPGFFGKGKVMATPATKEVISVTAAPKNIEGAKAFINFILTEYNSDRANSLSVDVLNAKAERAIGQKRVHEYGGREVRDTIYYTNNDYIELPDIGEAEVMTLLNAIKHDAFPVMRSPYIDYYSGSNVIASQLPHRELLAGEISAEEAARQWEEAVLNQIIDQTNN
jgi:hypothetical protein